MKHFTQIVLSSRDIISYISNLNSWILFNARPIDSQRPSVRKISFLWLEHNSPHIKKYKNKTGDWKILFLIKIYPLYNLIRNISNTWYIYFLTKASVCKKEKKEHYFSVLLLYMWHRAFHFASYRLGSISTDINTIFKRKVYENHVII